MGSDAWRILAACYGEGGEQAGEYLRTLSKLFSSKVIRGEGSAEEVQAAVRAWRKIPAAVDRAEELIARGLTSPNANQARSWEYLAAFGEMAKLLIG